MRMESAARSGTEIAGESSIYSSRSGLMLRIIAQPLFELNSLSSHCLK